MTSRAHKVVVLTDRDADGFRIGKGVELDGQELLLPSGEDIVVTVNDQGLMQATITVIADVEFRVVQPC